MSQFCTVKQNYTKYYSDPVTVDKGDEVILGKEDDEFPGWIWVSAVKNNKCGWMPMNIIVTSGDKHTALRSYNAMELTVNVGDRLKILEKESGWLLCQTETGEAGWIPEKNVEYN